MLQILHNNIKTVEDVYLNPIIVFDFESNIN